MTEDREALIERKPDGKFAKGTIGGYRKKRSNQRPSFYGVIQSLLEESGLTVEVVIWTIFRGLYDRAKRGDTQAAKLLLDKLTSPEKTTVEITHGLTPGPPLPGPDAFGDYVSTLYRIAIDRGMTVPADRRSPTSYRLSLAEVLKQPTIELDEGGPDLRDLFGDV
jgi:hypothetical protein